MVHIGEIKPFEKTIKLDKKDRKILSLLMLNARASLSELSKQVELSKSNIARRIKRLEKEGFINGYHAFVDVSKIGFKSCLVLMKTKTTSENKERYINKLISNENIYAVTEHTGNYDLAIGFYYKGEQKNEVLDLILDKEIIKDFEIFNIRTYFPKFDYTKEMISKPKELKLKFDDKIVNVDDTDIKILSELSKNCRVSLVDLANKMNIPRETINYRLKKLILNKVIAKFQPNVNFFMLDNEFYFVRFKLIKPSKKRDLIKYLAQTLRANTIIESDGSYQVMAFLNFKDNKEFRQFEDMIFKKFPEEIYDYSFELAKAQHKLEWF